MPVGTVKTLLDYAIGRSPDHPDILVLTLRVHDQDVPFALDRRIAERLSSDLAKVAAKLSAPRHEN